MTTPTATQIKDRSQVDFASLGYATDEQLDRLIAAVVPILEWITGRTMATMPSNLEETVLLCISRMVAVLAYQEQPEQIETVADFLLLSSFTAGSYSETRRSLTELRDAKLISGDPILNGFLMGLLTPDQLDWWMGWWSGENAPAFEITEVDWSSSRYGNYDDAPWMSEPIINYGPWSW